MRHTSRGSTSAKRRRGPTRVMRTQHPARALNLGTCKQQPCKQPVPCSALPLSAHAEAATCLAPSLPHSPSPSRPVSAHTEAATCAMPGEDEDESLAKRLRGCLIRCSGKIVY